MEMINNAESRQYLEFNAIHRESTSPVWKRALLHGNPFEEVVCEKNGSRFRNYKNIFYWKDGMYA